MKKIRLLALILCMVAATACFFACGNTGTSETAGSTDGENTIRLPEIGLDLFEDKELTLPESVSGFATWASTDETLVTVKDGIVSATGQKEGSAEVSATVGDISVIYPIKVEDSGETPALDAEPFSVYKGKTANIKEHLSLTYKEVEITEGVTYTYNPVGAQVTVAEDGTVSGVAVGTTIIKVKATYKGFQTSAKSVSVTIEEADIVKPAKDKVSLSIFEDDVDPNSYEIEAEAFINAEKVEDATIVASIEEGEDYVELNGLTITAKAVGKAVILLTYTGETKTVTGRIEVTVHDDTVEFKAGANLAPTTKDRSTFNKVFDGEFKDCYEYTLGTEGNYWDNAVTNTTVSVIADEGYKTFSYEIYFVDSAALVVYIPSAFQSGSGAYCMYDLSTIGNKFKSVMGTHTGDDDLLHIYGADGQRLADETELVTGQWYTIVYDLSTYSDGWSMLGFSINATANGQKAYLRNFAYHTTANLLPNGTYDARHPIGEVEDPEVTNEKDDFLNKLILGSKAVSVKKVVNGDFTGSYKIRSQTSAVVGSISFGDIHNAMNEPQDFFTKGYHYIKFEVYIASGNGLGICNWIKGVDGAADVKLADTIITPDTTVHETVRIYNERGNLSALKQGGWYTVLVNVPYDDENLPEWDLFYIGLPGSKYVPAIGYVRNFEYLKTDPEIVGDDSNIALNLTTSASLVKQTEAIDGVEEAYLYTNDTENWYTGRLDFKPETYYNKAIALKVRYNDAARLFYSVNYVNSYDGNNWTFGKNVHHFTLNGEYVKEPVENVWYELVIDLTATGKKDWMNYITMDVTGEKGKGVYIADLRILDECPFDIPEEDTSNIAKYISAPEAATLEKVGTYEGVENAYKYTNNGNWWSGRIGIDVNAFKGKYVSIKIRNEHDGTFNLYQNQKTVLGCSYARVYDLSGNKVKEMLKGTWYEIVLDYTEIDPEETYWCSYLEGVKPIDTYLADLQILDENPYPEEEPEETNIDKWVITGTVERQTGEIAGVRNAYLYTNTSNSFYGDVIGFDTAAQVTKGKVTMLKAKLKGSATVNYSIDWGNSIQKNNGWAFDNNIYYRTLKGDKVSALSSEEWRYIVIDLSGLTNWVNYICVNSKESMYIADLQILDKDPFFSIIDKYLSAPEEATMERVGTFENVENAYKYTNTGNWWTGRLNVATADFAGKYVSVKMYIDYAGTFILGGQAAAIGSLEHVKIYNLQGEEVSSLSQGAWYEVVIDYTTATPEGYWSSRIEPASTIITYLADLQILDENPHAANA